MVVALKRQKLVYGIDGYRVGAPQANLPAAR
jgi:hypothetical protein